MKGKIPLLLHIGHTKCGSTSIQKALAYNQELLAERGIFFFGRDMLCSQSNRVAAAPNTMLDDENRWAFATERVLEEAETSSDGARFVLSAEVLTQPRMAAWVSQWSDHFEVTILHYIRRQADWCYAAWKQWQIKRGISIHDWIDKCAARNHPDYYASFEAYDRQGLASDYQMNILAPDFLRDSNLLSDFFFRIGLDVQELSIPAGRANPSFDEAVIEIFRASPFLFHDANDNRPYEWALSNFGEAFVQNRAGLSAKLQERLMANHLERNKLIQAKFFPRRAADYWAHFSVPEADAEPTPPGEGEIDGLRRAMGYLVHAGMKLEQQNDRRMRKLADQLKALQDQLDSP